MVGYNFMAGYNFMGAILEKTQIFLIGRAIMHTNTIFYKSCVQVSNQDHT